MILIGRVIKVIALNLPWPPSTNTYYRSMRSGKLSGRVLISDKGRQYRNQVISQILSMPRTNMLTGKIAVKVYAYPPDKRKRDLDNIFKSLLDSLTHAQVWRDDSNIDDLHILRMQTIKGGKIYIEISCIN